MYDLIIIGSGPAGATAAIYASRANLKTIIFERSTPGGKLVNKGVLENYPGVGITTGGELAAKLFSQTTLFGAEFKFEGIKQIIDDKVKKVITTNGNTYEAHSIIIATGMDPRKLNIPGEAEYTSKGVSYCTICDGALYKGQPMAIIGGGNSAIEAAIFASNLSPKITLVNINNDLSGEQITLDKLKTVKNIEILNNTKTIEIFGDGKRVSGLKVIQNNQERTIELGAIFPYIGNNPTKDTFVDMKKLKTDNGFIIVNERMESSIPGIYGAGDIVAKELRQITTATSDGTIAAQNVNKYISKIKKG